MKKTIRGRSVKKPQSSTVRKAIATSQREESGLFIDKAELPKLWEKRGKELLSYIEEHEELTDLEEYLDAMDISYNTWTGRLKMSEVYTAYAERAFLKLAARRRRLANAGKYKEFLYKEDQYYYSVVLREVRKMLKEQRIEEHKHMEKNRNMEGQQSQHIPVFPVFLTDGEQIELEEFKAWKKAKAAGELT